MSCAATGKTRRAPPKSCPTMAGTPPATWRASTASWWPEPDFPRTSTLKVRRHLLPLPSEESQAAQHAPPPIEGDPVAEAVANIAHVTSVTDAQSLAELGIDSLAIVELVVQ